MRKQRFAHNHSASKWVGDCFWAQICLMPELILRSSVEQRRLLGEVSGRGAAKRKGWKGSWEVDGTQFWKKLQDVWAAGTLWVLFPFLHTGKGPDFLGGEMYRPRWQRELMVIVKLGPRDPGSSIFHTHIPVAKKKKLIISGMAYSPASYRSGVRTPLGNRGNGGPSGLWCASHPSLLPRQVCV